MPTDPPINTDQQTLNFNLLRAEIEAEAANWRKQDPEIATLESKIQRSWADLVPPGALTEDMNLLNSIERMSVIDYDTPIESQFLVSKVKKLLAKGMRWYIFHVTIQFTIILKAIVRYLKTLEQKTSDLENTHLLNYIENELYFPTPYCSETVVKQIATSLPSGHTLVISCGDGRLVDAILEIGNNTYGIDATLERMIPGLQQGLDLRHEDIIEHLCNIEDKSIDNIIFTGIVEAMSLPTILTLISEANRVLNSTGTLLVAVADPKNRNIIESQLRSNCGLSPTTWDYLLTNLKYNTTIIFTEDTRITEIVIAQR